MMDLYLLSTMIFGLCIIINLDIVSEDVVKLDCKGIKHNVTLSDLTLVD